MSRAIFCAKLLQQLRGNVQPYLDPIISVIKTGLSRRTFCVEAITCVSMISQAVGGAIVPHLQAPLSTSIVFFFRSVACAASHCGIALMLDAGLTAQLPPCLSELMQHRSFRNQIQEKLLDLLSRVLSNQPYYHPGTPESFISRRKNGTNVAPVCLLSPLWVCVCV